MKYCKCQSDHPMLLGTVFWSLRDTLRHFFVTWRTLLHLQDTCDTCRAPVGYLCDTMSDTGPKKVSYGQADVKPHKKKHC